MSPLTHLLASWVVASHTTDNARDARLVTLAGVLPDADGLGLLFDMLKDPSLQKGAFYYQEYHHFLAHGILGGVVMGLLLACFGRQRWRVCLLGLLVFHLHLLCDLVGSRGPEVHDVWPIYYLGPLSRHYVWIWTHQWQLDGWQNKIIGMLLFGWALWLACQKGSSFVGVFNRRVDQVFVGVLQRWKSAISMAVFK